MPQNERGVCQVGRLRLKVAALTKGDDDSVVVTAILRPASGTLRPAAAVAFSWAIPRGISHDRHALVGSERAYKSVRVPDVRYGVRCGPPLQTRANPLTLRRIQRLARPPIH
jgi:hypothetical protein